MQELGTAGEPAVEPLIQELAGSVDNDHRWYAALALSNVGAPAVDPLISAMRIHKENEFRRYAAAALGNIGIPAIEPVIDAMTGEDREMRGFLSRALPDRKTCSRPSHSST